MRVFWERAADTPLVSISVLARGGAGADADGLEGTAHHIAELAVRGAGELDRLGVDTELDRIGTSLSVNTSRDHIGYTAVCLARHAPRVVELLSDVLAKPRFDGDEHAKLVRESRSDLEEIRDDDADLAARFFSHFFWPTHPYGRAIEGSEASLKRLAAIDSSQLASSHRSMLGSDDLVVGVSGKITESEAQGFADQLADGLPDVSTVAPLCLPSSKAPSGPRVYLIEKPDRSQSQVLIGHLAPHYASSSGLALLLVEAAFGGMFSSRLMQEVRVKRGWSYDASIHLARGAQPSWIRMSLAPTAAVTCDAIALVIELYTALQESGLDQTELDLCRRFTVGSMLLSRATARQRVQQSCIGAVSGLDENFIASLPERLESLSVDEINNAIAEHLSAKDLTIVVVGGPELAKPLERFGDVSIVSYRSY